MSYSFSQTPASWSILGVILVISVIALRMAPGILDRNLLRPYWLLKKRQYDTIITSGFIHGDFGHLFFNALTLYSFGPALEHHIGTPHFVALYFIGLLVSSLGTVYKQRNNPNYAALGASGAILAVVFAYVVYFPKHTLLLFFVPMPAFVFAVGYLAYTIWASQNRRDNIAHDAHLDGALTGLIFVGLTDFSAWKHFFGTFFG
jgi:membrane associated rhomboid family serine protease